MTGGVSVRDVDVSSPLHLSQHEAREQILGYKSNGKQTGEGFKDKAQRSGGIIYKTYIGEVG